MKTSQTTAPATLGQVEQEVSRRRIAEAGALKCLIASASQTRRNVLSAAAASARWDIVVCRNATDGMSEFQRNVFQLAMIDLDDQGEVAAGMRELVETLASSSSKVLLGVCGHEADPAEEIWVRQLGVWLYLPGVMGSSEVSMLCEQAMRVVEDSDSKQELPMV